MDDFELNIVQESGPVHRGDKGKGLKKVNRRHFKVKNRGKSDINAVKMPAVVGAVPQKAKKRPRPEDGKSKPTGANAPKEEDKTGKKPKTAFSTPSPFVAPNQQQQGQAAATSSSEANAASPFTSSEVSKPAAAGKPISGGKPVLDSKPKTALKPAASKSPVAVKPAVAVKSTATNGHAKAIGIAKGDAVKATRPIAPTQANGKGRKVEESSEEEEDSSEDEAPKLTTKAGKGTAPTSVIIPRLDPTKLVASKPREEKKTNTKVVTAPAPAKPQPKTPALKQKPKAVSAVTEAPSDDEEEEEPESSEQDSDEEDEEEDEDEEEALDEGRRKPSRPQPAAVSAGDKPTRKTLTQAPAAADKLAEFHARPSLLSQAAAAQPMASTTSRHLFSTVTPDMLDLHPHLLSLLKAPRQHQGFGLKQCTRVQSAAIPRLGTGQNALLSSETGSGKTLAYLLPVLQQLQALEPRPQRSDGTLVLILAPTRELCHQINDVLVRLVKAFIWLVPGVITGGEKRKSEKARLRKGITVMVATPGRLLDHLQNTQCFEHKQLSWLVLDEADRLMDLGFEAQVRDIYNHLAEARGPTARPLQVITATATVTSAVDRLGRGLMGRHVRIDANKQTVAEVEEGVEEEEEEEEEEGSGDDEGSEEREEERRDAKEREKARKEREREKADESTNFVIPKQLVQQFMVVTCKLRLPALVSFLRAYCKAAKSVVFVSTCDSVDFHHMLFNQAKWIENDNEPLLGPSLPVYRLHGNIPQAERMQTFRAFSSAKVGVLLCTDVAARGLDLPAIDWIVQYDPPNETAEYVHRVGRTARKGLKGHALLFLLPSEKGYLDNLRGHNLEPRALSLENTLVAATPKRFARFRAPEEVYALEMQQQLESCVENDAALLASGRQAFQSFVRAYSTHSKELKPFFNVRSLHLGHVARSFALRVAPSSIKVNGVKNPLPSSSTAKPSPDSKSKPVKRRVILGVRPPRSQGDGEQGTRLGKRKEGPGAVDGGSKRMETKRKRAIVHQAQKAVADEFAA